MSDLCLMKKVIILKKMQVTIKTFAPPFFQPFQFEPEQKKTCGNESHEKETKRIYASAANLLHIRIGKYTYYTEDFRSTIFQSFQFEPEQK